jgi:hypothetical protein
MQYEINYLTFGFMRQITTFVVGYETKNEWNTMSMINETTGFYNTIYFQKIECMFLNALGRKLQCSTVVFMKVSRSEPISLTCLQPERSLITLFYCRVAPLHIYF